MLGNQTFICLSLIHWLLFYAFVVINLVDGNPLQVFHVIRLATRDPIDGPFYGQISNRSKFALQHGIHSLLDRSDLFGEAREVFLNSFLDLRIGELIVVVDYFILLQVALIELLAYDLLPHGFIKSNVEWLHGQEAEGEDGPEKLVLVLTRV